MHHVSLLPDNEQNEIYLVHAFVNVRNMCTLHVYRDE